MDDVVVLGKVAFVVCAAGVNAGAADTENGLEQSCDGAGTVFAAGQNT